MMGDGKRRRLFTPTYCWLLYGFPHDCGGTPRSSIIIKIVDDDEEVQVATIETSSMTTTATTATKTADPLRSRSKEQERVRMTFSEANGLSRFII
jgi:hypothetical protein